MEINDDELSYSIDFINKLKSSYKQSIIGQEDLLITLLISLFTENHLLIEGVPGLAKTRAVNTIAQSTSLKFKRVQFTPDLLPSDLVGNLVFNPKDAKYFVKTGPVFTNILLADEINRAPAKVQSALLESMQEKQVTIGENSYQLPVPFVVLATQNPIEQEGTFNLPEAQVDRFLLKTLITYPSNQEEIEVLNLLEKGSSINVRPIATPEDILKIRDIVKKVTFAPKLKEYVVSLVDCTRHPDKYGLKDLQNIISYGVSPRAGIAFLQAGKAYALLQGKKHVEPEDIKKLSYDVLRHRILLSFEAEADQIKVESVIEKIINTVKVP
ncbi:MAG TPA: MoxR family ATPase [Candidatus Dojkabacteria bacterium]|nr:MoxR family ATPase [Candidatus Dojkabacteria bacterium]HRO64997.1 MoxR family ATPase [Candidatus Dojkabacteria bacterium]HRP51521.1 MoxR family ATPase [Candidatus Dojkabacteria bacterium]